MKLTKIRDILLGGAANSRRHADCMLLVGSQRTDEILKKENITSLKDVEFKVFSQSGEDGILQWLTHKIPIENRTFIEFGASDYKESNTRFLLIKDNWSGMILDGSKKNMSAVKQEGIYWRYDLQAIDAFITAENINDLLMQSGFDKDLGVLSVDIDGNDYWVLKAITEYQPRILVCEYNAVFGEHAAVTIPYKKDFFRTAEHYSNLYWGASLLAFKHLAEEKGYTFIGTNSNAVNAFFVRNDLAGYLPLEHMNMEFIENKIRESRDENGRLTFTAGKERAKIIAEKEVYDVIDNKMKKIRDIVI